MATESNPPAQNTSEKLYQARLKLIEYHVENMQAKLENYEAIGSILAASLDVKRARVGRVLMSLVSEVNNRTCGIQAVVEDLRKQQK